MARKWIRWDKSKNETSDRQLIINRNALVMGVRKDAPKYYGKQFQAFALYERDDNLYLMLMRNHRFEEVSYDDFAVLSDPVGVTNLKTGVSGSKINWFIKSFGKLY